MSIVKAFGIGVAVAALGATSALAGNYNNHSSGGKVDIFVKVESYSKAVEGTHHKPAYSFATGKAIGSVEAYGTTTYEASGGYGGSASTSSPSGGSGGMGGGGGINTLGFGGGGGMGGHSSTTSASTGGGFSVSGSTGN
jgi:hypothetical protein